MCFGVKNAIKAASELAESKPVTILGELAHNATVKRSLTQLGAQHGDLHSNSAPTKHIIITAHGASDRDRKRWKDLGYSLTDTTCPLVHRAHNALRQLVVSGYAPIVIGKAGHVEGRGLTGEFPDTQTILSLGDVEQLEISSNKIGIISQTTQQIHHVAALVHAIRQRYPFADVRFIDTVCRPTKDRQQSLLKLCSRVEVVIVVGGKNSNNTAQLAAKCRKLGCAAYHIQQPSDIDPAWFKNVSKVGLTAGTSTPDSDISRVKTCLIQLANTPQI